MNTDYQEEQGQHFVYDHETENESNSCTNYE